MERRRDLFENACSTEQVLLLSSSNTLSLLHGRRPDVAKLWWEIRDGKIKIEGEGGSIVFRIKLQLVFFLPSILSEKQPLFWLRVGTGCRRVSARKLLRVYGKRGRGEGSVLYSSGTELANEIREFEYKLRRGHGEWDYGGVGKLFSFFFFFFSIFAEKGIRAKSTDLFSNVVIVRRRGGSFGLVTFFRLCHLGAVNEVVINEIFNKMRI